MVSHFQRVVSWGDFGRIPILVQAAPDVPRQELDWVLLGFRRFRAAGGGSDAPVFHCIESGRDAAAHCGVWAYVVLGATKQLSMQEVSQRMDGMNNVLLRPFSLARLWVGPLPPSQKALESAERGGLNTQYVGSAREPDSQRLRPIVEALYTKLMGGAKQASQQYQEKLGELLLEAEKDEQVQGSLAVYSLHAASLHLVLGQYEAADAAAHIAIKIFDDMSSPLYLAKALEIVAAIRCRKLPDRREPAEQQPLIRCVEPMQTALENYRSVDLNLAAQTSPMLFFLCLRAFDFISSHPESHWLALPFLSAAIEQALVELTYTTAANAGRIVQDVHAVLDRCLHASRALTFRRKAAFIAWLRLSIESPATTAGADVTSTLQQRPAPVAKPAPRLPYSQQQKHARTQERKAPSMPQRPSRGPQPNVAAPTAAGGGGGGKETVSARVALHISVARDLGLPTDVQSAARSICRCLTPLQVRALASLLTAATDEGYTEGIQYCLLVAVGSAVNAQSIKYLDPTIAWVVHSALRLLSSPTREPPLLLASEARGCIVTQGLLHIQRAWIECIPTNLQPHPSQQLFILAPKDRDEDRAPITRLSQDTLLRVGLCVHNIWDVPLVVTQFALTSTQGWDLDAEAGELPLTLQPHTSTQLTCSGRPSATGHSALTLAHLVVNGLDISMDAPALAALRVDVCEPLPLLTHHVLEAAAPHSDHSAVSLKGAMHTHNDKFHVVLQNTGVLSVEAFEVDCDDANIRYISTVTEQRFVSGSLPLLPGHCVVLGVQVAKRQHAPTREDKACPLTTSITTLSITYGEASSEFRRRIELRVCAQHGAQQRPRLTRVEAHDGESATVTYTIGPTATSSQHEADDTSFAPVGNGTRTEQQQQQQQQQQRWRRRQQQQEEEEDHSYGPQTETLRLHVNNPTLNRVCVSWLQREGAPLFMMIPPAAKGGGVVSREMVVRVQLDEGDILSSVGARLRWCFVQEGEETTDHHAFDVDATEVCGIDGRSDGAHARVNIHVANIVQRSPRALMVRGRVDVPATTPWKAIAFSPSKREAVVLSGNTQIELPAAEGSVSFTVHVCALGAELEEADDERHGLPRDLRLVVTGIGSSTALPATRTGVLTTIPIFQT